MCAQRDESLLDGVRAGVGATLTMDAAMVLASQLAPEVFATDKVDVNLIGRWVGSLGSRTRVDGDITSWPTVRNEVALGLAAHYVTGTVLTEAYLIALRRLGIDKGPIKAVAYGAATAVLPLLVMFPSMGYGWCGRRSDDARRIVAVMMVGHVAFGAGIAACTAYQTPGTKRRGTRRR
jgi:hypothetical protein